MIIKKVPEDLKEDFGNLIHEMTLDLLVDTGLTSFQVLNILSKYYNVSVEDIKECLKMVDSEIVKNNNIVYYDNGIFIKRTTIAGRLKKILPKIVKRIKNIDPLIDYNDIFKSMEYINTH